MRRSEWYTVIDDERGTLRLEFFRGMAFLHLAFLLPLAGMRAARAGLGEIKAILKAIGFKRVHVVIPDNDAKLYRFERMFGFSEEKRHGGFILMGQET